MYYSEMLSIRFRLLAVSFSLLCLDPTLAWSKTLIIQGATLVSPDRLDQRHVRDVLVQDGRIKAIGDHLSSQDAEVISGKGLFLSPGLMDVHVHLQAVPGMSLGMDKAHPEIAEDYYKQLPKSYLFYGFTSLLDLAVLDLNFIEKLSKQKLRPDIWHCGGALAISEGYPMMFLPERERYQALPNFLYDERFKKHIPRRHRPEDHTPQASVQRVKESGGICAKTFLESGWGDQQWPQITPKMMADVRKETRKHGLRLLAHANSIKDFPRLVSDKVDASAHGLWNWGPHNGSKNVPQEIREVLDQMIKNDTAYIPTLRVIVGIGTALDNNFIEDPKLKHVLPASLLSWYKTTEGKHFQNELVSENPKNKNPNEGRKIFESLGKNGELALAYFYKNGGRILMGSDTPSSPTWGNPPGYNGYLELLIMEKAGMKSQDVFKSATLESAKYFELDKEIGTIEPGKRANLLLLEKDPSQGLKALETIRWVFVNGEAVERKNLSALSAPTL